MDIGGKMKGYLEAQITGLVASVEMTGYGPNSAQMIFTIQPTPPGLDTPLNILSPPVYTNEAFAAMSNLVTSAFYARQLLKVDYYVIPGQIGQPFAITTA